MPQTHLDAADAVELAEHLQFINDWIATEHDHVTVSLARFVGTCAYSVDQLQADLHRFTFLLGGNDDEPLFNPDTE